MEFGPLLPIKMLVKFASVSDSLGYFSIGGKPSGDLISLCLDVINVECVGAVIYPEAYRTIRDSPF